MGQHGVEGISPPRVYSGSSPRQRGLPSQGPLQSLFLSLSLPLPCLPPFPPQFLPPFPLPSLILPNPHPCLSVFMVLGFSWIRSLRPPPPSSPAPPCTYAIGPVSSFSCSLFYVSGLLVHAARLLSLFTSSLSCVRARARLFHSRSPLSVLFPPQRLDQTQRDIEEQYTLN